MGGPVSCVRSVTTTATDPLKVFRTYSFVTFCYRGYRAEWCGMALLILSTERRQTHSIIAQYFTVKRKLIRQFLLLNNRTFQCPTFVSIVLFPLLSLSLSSFENQPKKSQRLEEVAFKHHYAGGQVMAVCHRLIFSYFYLFIFIFLKEFLWEKKRPKDRERAIKQMGVDQIHFSFVQLYFFLLLLIINSFCWFVFHGNWLGHLLLRLPIYTHTVF